MNQQKNNKKIKRILRQTLVSVLCLVCVFGMLSDNIFAAESGTGYIWTRIHNWDELKNYQGKDNFVNSSDHNLAGDKGWFRALIIYEGDKYFMSGSRLSGGSYVGQPVKATYGIDADKDSFETRSGLNAPYLKYMAWDSDNNAPLLTLAFSNGDEVSANCLLGNASWYGVAEHACYTMEFKSAPRDNPYSVLSKASWASNVTGYYRFTMKFNMSGNNGLAHMFYNIPGVSDAAWMPDDSEIDPDYRSDILDEKDSGFKLYLGSPFIPPVHDIDYTVDPGKVEIWDTMEISPNTTVTVKENATLVISGLVFNNGVFIVDGGTLIVRGVVDTDSNLTQTMKSDRTDITIDKEVCPGSIFVTNGGQLIIENSGSVITRCCSLNNGASIRLSGNSSAYVSGFAVLPQGIAVEDHSTFRVSPGGFIACGVIPKDTVKQSCYNAAWLVKNGSHSLSSMCDLVNPMSPNMTKDSEGKEIVHDDKRHIALATGLYLSDNSSFIDMGGLFMNPVFNLSSKDSSYVFAYTATNYKAQLIDMLWTTTE